MAADLVPNQTSQTSQNDNSDKSDEDLETRYTREKKRSQARIRAAILKSGGAPFGAPFGIGLQSLTSGVIRWFRQKGFFGFENFEALPKRNRRNRFTSHGAAPFVGTYDAKGDDDSAHDGQHSKAKRRKPKKVKGRR